MVFKRRRNGKSRDQRSNGADYESVAMSRLRVIAESGGYPFSPDDRDDVEARIRRMFYGANRGGGHGGEAEETAT